jgi:hypothetical protein
MLGLGWAATAPVTPFQAPSVWAAIALPLPPKPFPGQMRTDGQGHCPRGYLVPINGGCWVPVRAVPKDCDEDAYVYNGGCYIPAFPPERVPTASPAVP